MKKRIFVIITICLSLLTACEQADMTTLFNPDDVTFYASNGDMAATKTILQADGTIEWLPKEEINVFYGSSGSAKFVSDNTEQAGTVAFKGALKDFSYQEGNAFWAVYPYRESNVYTGESVTVSLPSQQTALTGSFADDLFVSIARTTDFNLQFYNVCGGIKFCVTEAGVKTVTFQGNGDEPVAGSAKVGINSEGKPEIKEVTEAVTTITLSPPDGNTFEKGSWYYIAVWPTALKNGYKITLTKEDGTSTIKRNGSPVTVKRAIWGVLENLDKGLVYKLRVPDNEIWYTTTDGKPISVGSDVMEVRGITHNEYADGRGRLVFADMAKVNYDIFSGSNNLKSIQLPESVTTITGGCFYEKTKLETVDMPGVIYIEKSAFEGSGLSGDLILPESLEEIGESAFFRCSGLTSITIPKNVTIIREGAFFDGNYTHLVFEALEPPIIEGFYPLDARLNLWERKCLLYVPESSLGAYQSAWHHLNAYITTQGKMPQECYYCSSDYTRDGEVVRLQTASVGKGIDLVFIGDGYVDRDLEPDGIFEQLVKTEVETFFSVEPYKSFKDRFNVTLVKCVSKNDVYFSPFGADRRLTVDLDRYRYYQEDLTICEEYARKAVASDTAPLYVGVILNNEYDGELACCTMLPLENKAFAVSTDRRPADPYCMLHELGGHGVGLLSDEYIGAGRVFPEELKAVFDEENVTQGKHANIDWRSNPEEVRWSRFLKDSRYTEEGLGVYEGASIYEFGIYRCSLESVMNGCGPNGVSVSGYSGWFNAPSREQIYKQVMKLSEGPDWKYDYETFVEFDAAGREQAKTKYKEWQEAYAAWLLQNGQN